LRFSRIHNPKLETPNPELSPTLDNPADSTTVGALMRGSSIQAIMIIGIMIIRSDSGRG